MVEVKTDLNFLCPELVKMECLIQPNSVGKENDEIQVKNTAK